MGEARRAAAGGRRVMVCVCGCVGACAFLPRPLPPSAPPPPRVPWSGAQGLLLDSAVHTGTVMPTSTDGRCVSGGVEAVIIVPIWPSFASPRSHPSFPPHLVLREHGLVRFPRISGDGRHLTCSADLSCIPSLSCPSSLLSTCRYQFKTASPVRPIASGPPWECTLLWPVSVCLPADAPQFHTFPGRIIFRPSPYSPHTETSKVLRPAGAVPIP